MSDSRCISLVLYESQPELLEAARAVVADSALIELRAGGWEELRTATDLDAVLSGDIHKEGLLGLAPRYGEAIVANVEWARDADRYSNISIRARWLIAPPLLGGDPRTDDANLRHRTLWSIIHRDVAALPAENDAVPLMRLGAPGEWAYGVPDADASAKSERVQQCLRSLSDLVEQFYRWAKRDEPPASPR